MIKKTTILTFALLCLFIVGCKKNTAIGPQSPSRLPIPSIAIAPEAYPEQFHSLEFEWQYIAPGSFQSANGTYDALYWKPDSCDKIPKPTADYTRYLIYELFLSDLGNFGARYDHVSLDNYTQTVKFTLQFQPLELCEDSNEIWSCRLVVAPVHEGLAGKYLELERFLISQNGHILYPTSDGAKPAMSGVRECKRTDRGLLIDIISNHPEEYYSRRTEDPHEPFKILSTQYLHQPAAASLDKITTRTENMDGLGAGYYLQIPGW